MKKLTKALIAIGATAACVATGGLAAPAIGAAVGSSLLGLSGAAATSAGLAALGGGSIAAGGLGVAGGTLLVQAVAGGAGIVSAHIASNAIEGAKAKKENEKFREQLKKAKIDDATKQKIIIKLNEKINSIQTALGEEKRRTQCSEEKIKAMELQLDELEKTLCLAQAI